MQFSLISGQSLVCGPNNTKSVDPFVTAALRKCTRVRASLLSMKKFTMVSRDFVPCACILFFILRVMDPGEGRARNRLNRGIGIGMCCQYHRIAERHVIKISYLFGADGTISAPRSVTYGLDSLLPIHPGNVTLHPLHFLFGRLLVSNRKVTYFRGALQFALGDKYVVKYVARATENKRLPKTKRATQQDESNRIKRLLDMGFTAARIWAFVE